MLVEGIAMQQALASLAKRAMTNQQIGHEIDQQQLPCGQLRLTLDKPGTYQQNDRNGYQPQLA